MNTNSNFITREIVSHNKLLRQFWSNCRARKCSGCWTSGAQEVNLIELEFIASGTFYGHQIYSPGRVLEKRVRGATHQHRYVSPPQRKKCKK
jgi:hypothetical protein